MAGNSNSRIVNYDDRTARARYESLSFDEQAAFRQRMKGIEEYATSGAVTEPGAAIAGQRVRVVHRIGGRFDVQVQDPFTKQARTVASHRYDLRGRRVGTDVAWRPGNPESVAAVFGIPFVSAFGELESPEPKSQDETDEAEYRKVAHDSYMEHMRKKAKEQGYAVFVRRNYGHVKDASKVPPEHRTEWERQRKEGWRR